MKKENKKTEHGEESNEQKKDRKIMKFGTLAPALSAVLVVACAGASVAAYTPKVYAVQKPSPKAAETSQTSEEAQAETMNLEGQVFDLPDGIYEGTGTGFAGKITVAVEIKDKKIVAITVLNVEADDAAFFNRAKAVIDRIIQSQNLDVDVVSGATYSSRGIISAVKNALTGEKDSGKTAENPAQGQGSTTLAAAMDAGAYRDGTYYGSATGFAGPIKVKVVIADGKIVSVEIVETSDGSSYIGKASSIMGQIVASQSTNVDTVSGATYSSVGIINAVRNALAQAAVNPEEAGQQVIVAEVPNQQVEEVPAVPTVSGNFPYPDGTYYGTAEGYLGDITVAVVIQNQTIQSVEIVDNVDDAAYFDRARVVANRVVNQQTTSVDIVSGATYSSRGIINAIQAALDTAKGAANQTQPVSPTPQPDNGTNGDSGNSGNTGGDTTNPGSGSEEGKQSVYYADGSYPVTVLCEPDEDEDFETYHLSATIVIKNDRVTEITNVSGDGDSGNNSYIKRAVNGTSSVSGMVTRIIGMAVADMTGENAGTEMEQNLMQLDTVSRATCTSKSIKAACQEALHQAREKFLADSAAQNETQPEASDRILSAADVNADRNDRIQEENGEDSAE